MTSTSIVGILGTLAAYAIGPFVSYQATGYFVLVINLVHVVGILFIPESPVYYAIKGKKLKINVTNETNTEITLYVILTTISKFSYKVSKCN